MTRLEKVRKQREAEQATKERLRAEIKDLEERQKQLRADALATAEAGDTDLYMKKEALADRCSKELYVKHVQLSKIGSVDPAEVKAAWYEYIKPVNAEMRKAFNEYKAARRELLKKLQYVVQLQDQAYRTREQCAIWAGASRADRDFYDTVQNNYGMDMLTLAEVSNDLKFFQSVGDLDREESNSIGKMTLQNKPRE